MISGGPGGNCNPSLVTGGLYHISPLMRRNSLDQEMVLKDLLNMAMWLSLSADNLPR